MHIDSGLTNFPLRRRAVTGLLVGLIIFGLIFGVGLSYFLYENQLSTTSAQAQANAQAAEVQQGQESLSLSVHAMSSGKYANWLYVEVYDSSGVPSVITSVFVTSLSGSLLSKSSLPAGSQYLVGPPDLNVTLPLPLEPGQNTTNINGCWSGSGCSIGINTAAYHYTSGAVYIDVLTQAGNVFSAEYPKPTGTTTTTTNTVSASTTTLTSPSTTYTTLTSYTTLTTSSILGVGFGIGTDSLLVSMRACAGTSPFSNNCGTGVTVYQNQEVVLEINVTNFASVAMNVYVQFQSIGTNGAGVSSSSPSSCAGKTPTQSVQADTGSPGTQTYTCTFTGSTGPTGGTLTFIGFAVGTYTMAPAPPVTITSAEATSNPLPMGNPASSLEGPWILNYFSFNYASSQHNAWTSAQIISASGNSKVIFQVQLTNTANASLTVLQYTYLQVVRTSQEQDYYLISPVASWTSSISSYACTNGGAGGSPTGTACTVAQTNCAASGNGCVPVGATATLSFAACATAGNSFMWANRGGGNGACGSNNANFGPPEGLVIFVVVVYDYYFAGTWHTFAQSIPATGVFITS